MVEMEATNVELEDNNTRLEAAALKAAEQAAEMASLRAALTAREQQHSALKVCNQRRFSFCPVRKSTGPLTNPCLSSRGLCLLKAL